PEPPPPVAAAPAQEPPEAVAAVEPEPVRPPVVRTAQKPPAQDTPRASKPESLSEEILLKEIRSVATKVKNDTSLSDATRKKFGGYLYQLQLEAEDSTAQDRARIRKDLHEFKESELK
ncbi:hypothetical protein, partial [Corallococcus sicarius]